MMETRIKVECDECKQVEEAVNTEQHVFLRQLIDQGWMLGNKDHCLTCRGVVAKRGLQKDKE